MAKQVSKAVSTPTKPAARKGKAAPVAAPAAAPDAAPVAAPAAPAPAVVALRGGLVVGAVQVGTKPYRVAAAHNAAWWQAIGACCAANGGKATVAQLAAQPYGVPANFVGYVLRRGYLLQA